MTGRLIVLIGRCDTNGSGPGYQLIAKDFTNDDLGKGTDKREYCGRGHEAGIWKITELLLSHTDLYTRVMRDQNC